MNSSEESLNRATTRSNSVSDNEVVIKRRKPPFRPAKDDTKPLLQDPILRPDTVETDEAVLILPPFRPTK